MGERARSGTGVRDPTILGVDEAIGVQRVAIEERGAVVGLAALAALGIVIQDRNTISSVAPAVS